MGKAARKLYEEALQLEPSERAELTSLLLENLDPVVEEGVEEAWAKEIDRRISDIDSGAVQLVSWEEVRAKLYARLK